MSVFRHVTVKLRLALKRSCFAKVLGVNCALIISYRVVHVFYIANFLLRKLEKFLP